MSSLTTEQRNLILGALDSLALALADYDHEWTIGEREIYEQSVALLKGEPFPADI